MEENKKKTQNGSSKKAKDSNIEAQDNHSELKENANIEKESDNKLDLKSKALACWVKVKEHKTVSTVVASVLLVGIILAIVLPITLSGGSSDSSSSGDNSSSSSSSSSSPVYPADSVGIILSLKENGTYEVTGIGDCHDEEIALPASKDGKAVTSIGNESFIMNGDITSIVIPSSVTSIGDYAFCDCKQLKTIIFKGSKAQWDAISKGKNWDYNLTGLIIKCEDGTINNASSTVASVGLSFEINEAGTAYNLSGIGTCTDEIILVPSQYEGKSVTAVKENAFVTNDSNYYYSSLENVKALSLPDTILTIGDMAFPMSTSLQCVSFSSSLREIGDYAFYNSGLKTVNIPEGVTTLGLNAFGYCCDLKKVTIPTTITDFGNSDSGVTRGSSDTADNFYQCEALEEIVLKEGITTLGSGMFGGCSSLKEVNIPSTLTEIPAYLFTQCKNLEKITFHSSLSKMGIFSFNNAPVTEIDFIGGTRKQWKDVLDASIPDAKDVTNIFGMNICYFVNCSDGYYIDVDTYYNNMQNTPTEDKDDPSKGMYNGVDSTNSDWKKLVIPSTCGGLTMTSACEATFAGFQSLNFVSIPHTLTKLSKSMFAGCTSLSRILYDGTIAEWNALEKGDNWNYGLANVSVYCTDGKASDVNSPNTYVASEGLAFEEDNGGYLLSGLGTCEDRCIFVPDSYNGKKVTGVKSGAFYTTNTGETPLISCLFLPEAVTSIGSFAFKGCAALRAAFLPNSLTNIGTNAFENTNLRELTIPENVRSVYMAAFKGCKNLKKATLNNTKDYPSWGSEVFYGCTLENIIFNGKIADWQYVITYSKIIDSSSTGYVVTCLDGRQFDDVNYASLSTFAYATSTEGYLTINGIGDGVSKPNTLIINSKYDGSTVNKIGDGAFKNSKFDNIVLPNTITSFGTSAFEELHLAGYIYYKGTIAEWNAIEKGTDWAKDTSFTVCCVDGDITVK